MHGAVSVPVRLRTTGGTTFADERVVAGRPSLVREEHSVAAGDSWTPPHDIVEEGVEELLQGAYDLHVHAGPDRRPRRYDTLDLVQRFVDAGFAGAVVKDHFLPTSGRAQAMKRLYPDFDCFSTIVLNGSVGGLNVTAVESALDSGVQWFFMPTVSARFFREAEGHGPPDRPNEDLVLTNDDGTLKDEVHEILEVLSGQDVVLASGHVSPEESVALFEEAQRREVSRNIVTHGTINFVRMPVEIQQRIAQLGGYIEHAYVSCCLAPTVGLDEIWSEMQAVGLSSCYLASDLGQPHNPAPITGWRAAVGGLLSLGATHDDIRTLVAEVPRRIIDGLPRYPGTWITDEWEPGDSPLAVS